jgi:hypothetical protein
MACVPDARVQWEQAQKVITAIHEAGHVLGERLMGSKIKEATILPTRCFNGQVTPEIGLQNYRYDHEGTIICLLLGHATELEFGYRSEYGHGSDYARVEKMLKEDIKGKKSKTWSQKTGVRGKMFNHVTKKTEPCDIWFAHQVVGGYYDAKGNYVSYRKEWMKAVRVMRSEWRPEFNKFVRKARRVARKQRAYIEMVARLLTEKGTLTDAEIPSIEDVQC